MNNPTQSDTTMPEDRYWSDAEMLRRIAKDHLRLAPNAHHSAETMLQIADRIDAAISAMSAPAEPVAWMYSFPGHPKTRFAPAYERQIPLAEGWTETPLYALLDKDVAMVPKTIGEPVAWISSAQLAAIEDGDDKAGTYLPIRKTKYGNFTTPLYTHLTAEPITELQRMGEENARLKLDLEAKDCLMDSQYIAGVKAGWNLCVDDDQAGLAKITGNTDHIAELKRIRAAALSELIASTADEIDLPSESR